MLGSRLGATGGVFEVLGWWLGLSEGDWDMLGCKLGESDGDRFGSIAEGRLDALGSLLSESEGRADMLGSRLGATEGAFELLGWWLGLSEGKKEEVGSLLDAIGKNDVLCGVIVWLDGFSDKEGNWDGVDETLGLKLVRDATSLLGAWEKLWVSKVVSVPDEKREGTSVSGHLLGVLDVVPTPFTPVRVENPVTLRSIEAYSTEEIALSIASIRSSSFLRLRTDLSIKTSNTRTTIFGNRFRRKDCWTKRGSCDVMLICKITADICDVVNTLLTKFFVNDIHLVNNSVFNAGSP
jgi:hypothetical protein